MIQSRVFFSYTLGICLLLFTSGCSKSTLGAQVSGKVTLDGKPLEAGSIIFAPSDRMSNNAFGAINGNGNYFLKSNRTIGLPPGKYKVSVAMYERIDIKPGERSMVAPKLLTPRKYADVNTSGLEFDVSPGSNTIDISLVSD